MKYTQVKNAGYWRRFADGWNMLIHPIDNWNEWGRDAVKNEVRDITGTAGQQFGQQAAQEFGNGIKKQVSGAAASAQQWIKDKVPAGTSALGGAVAGGLLGYGLGGMGGKKRKPLRTLATVAGAGLGALGGYWLYDKLGKKASMKYSDIQRLRKTAALGWKEDDTNITNKFHDHLFRQSVGAAGAQFGALGGALAHGIGALGGGKPAREDLPDFHPEKDVYIGKAYKVPEDEQSRADLYTKLTGETWEPTAPKWMDGWLIDDRKQRILNALQKKIYKGEAPGAKKLSNGELASLLYPNYVLKSDRTVATGPYPVKGLFNIDTITKKDIQEYLDK
jgi:hypothetical protein